MASLRHFRAIVPVFEFALVSYHNISGCMSVSYQGDSHYCVTQSGRTYVSDRGGYRQISDIVLEHDPDERNGLIGIVRTMSNTYLSFVTRDSKLDICKYRNYTTTFSQKTILKSVSIKSSYCGKIIKHDAKIFAATPDGCIWEITQEGVSSKVLSGFVCPWSFSIDKLGRFWVGDDTPSSGRVYLLHPGERVTPDIEPVFEYPYTEDTGCGIIGGFFDSGRYYFADRAGYVNLLEYRHSKLVQVAHHKITDQRINGIYKASDGIHVCIQTGIVKLKLKVRSSGLDRPLKFAL